MIYGALIFLAGFISGVGITAFVWWLTDDDDYDDKDPAKYDDLESQRIRRSNHYHPRIPTADGCR